MVFQYQYQYQYQLQRGLGLTTYDSFSNLLHDTYSNPVLLSLLVAIVPLFVFFFKDRIVKTRVYKTLSFLYNEKKKEKQLKKAREEFEATFLGRGQRDVFAVIFLGFVVLLGGLIFTKSLFFVAVTSNSMAPAFWSGDLVLVQSMSPDYQQGDIVVFYNPSVRYEENVIHRIVSIAGDGITTKGDNNNFPDDWALSKSDMVGSALTYNGRPIVAKNVGRYFIKDFDFQREARYEVQLMRSIISNIHDFGPMYLIIIFMLILLTQLQQPEGGKVY